MSGTIKKDTQSEKRTVRRARTRRRGLVRLAVTAGMASAASMAIAEPALARIALNHNESAARDRG